MAATDQGIFPVGRRTSGLTRTGIQKDLSYLTKLVTSFKGVRGHMHMISKLTKPWARFHTQDCFQKLESTGYFWIYLVMLWGLGLR